MVNRREYLKKYMREKRSSKEFKFKESIRRKTNYFFKRDKKCCVCESKIKLEFHHLKYVLPLNKEDVVTLCNKCHSRVKNGFIEIKRARNY